GRNFVGDPNRRIEQAFRLAQEQYAELGVDVDRAISRLGEIPISLHCWQGDDVGGIEQSGSELGGGLAVRGNYPGRARTPAELRADFAKPLSLLHGRHRMNLHACYVDAPSRIERNAIRPEHFQNWIDWARELRLGMDFNPTFFAHAKAADGFTLTHSDPGVRRFWIEHGIACRQIG